MFERYQEKARRVIFFARHEASISGSPYIEAEHLLLGLLREDKALFAQVLAEGRTESGTIVGELRTAVTSTGKAIDTSVDLPVSASCKRALVYAVEESERLNHSAIGTNHLLLGIMREAESMAAVILTKHGLDLGRLRLEFANKGHSPVNVGSQVDKNFEIIRKLRAEFEPATRRLTCDTEPATTLQLK